jgi:hypothetical protein
MLMMVLMARRRLGIELDALLQITAVQAQQSINAAHRKLMRARFDLHLAQAGPEKDRMRVHYDQALLEYERAVASTEPVYS